jgi:transposase
MRPVGSAEELERRRTRAVELLEEGVSRKLLARILGVSPASLSRWRRLAGAGALEAKPNVGPKQQLTDEDCEELEELLLEGATAHGWHNNLWTAARVGEVIFRHFGVKYHPAHVSRVLRNRLAWTSQKPACQRRDPDDTAIETWASCEPTADR